MIFNQIMPSHVAKDGWDQDQTFHLSSRRLDSWNDNLWGPPLDPNKNGALGVMKLTIIPR